MPFYATLRLDGLKLTKEHTRWPTLLSLWGGRIDKPKYGNDFMGMKIM